LSLRVGEHEKPFQIEDGKLFMQTKPGYWTSYMNSFSAREIEQMLGLEEPMTLIAKKNSNANLKKIETTMKRATKPYGKDLIWEDTMQETYDAMKSYGRSIDNLYTFGDTVAQYADQLVKELTNFCKSPEALEQLTKELTADVVGLKVGESDATFSIEDGKLWMHTKPGYYGSYMNSFNVDALEKVLGKEEPYPLKTLKNINAKKKSIETLCGKMTKCFQREIIWADNWKELYDERKTYGAGDDNLYQLGDQVEQYVKQADTAFAGFCKDADNLEALQEEFTSGQIGVRITDSAADKGWKIEDGNLWMETKAGYWTSYLNSFSKENLEGIL